MSAVPPDLLIFSLSAASCESPAAYRAAHGAPTGRNFLAPVCRLRLLKCYSHGLILRGSHRSPLSGSDLPGYFSSSSPLLRLYNRVLQFVNGFLAFRREIPGDFLFGTGAAAEAGIWPDKNYMFSAADWFLPDCEGQRSAAKLPVPSAGSAPPRCLRPGEFLSPADLP